MVNQFKYLASTVKLPYLDVDSQFPANQTIPCTKRTIMQIYKNKRKSAAGCTMSFFFWNLALFPMERLHDAPARVSVCIGHGSSDLPRPWSCENTGFIWCR